MKIIQIFENMSSKIKTTFVWNIIRSLLKMIIVKNSRYVNFFSASDVRNFVFLRVIHYVWTEYARFYCNSDRKHYEKIYKITVPKIFLWNDCCCARVWIIVYNSLSVQRKPQEVASLFMLIVYPCNQKHKAPSIVLFRIECKSH